MNKNLKIASIILVFTAILIGCRKDELPKEVLVNGKSKLSIGDGVWDVLGYGFDATGDLTSDFTNIKTTSDAPIIDVARFATDYGNRINIDNGSFISQNYFAGTTALDYLKDVVRKKTFGLGATIAGKDNFLTGSLNVNHNREDQTRTTLSSKYSYATYESYRKVKQISFTGDATIDLLKTYLTPEFINNVANQDAETLVNRYGTHVLLDITLGGRLRFDFSAIIEKEIDYERKLRATKGGLLGGIIKGLGSLVGINVDANISREEITQMENESRERQYTLNIIGGTTSGRSISYDANGYSSETINIGSWEQSLNPSNSKLINIGRAVPLYELISDPVKKDQVKIAVDNYIRDKEAKELGEVPIYVYNHILGINHYYTPVNQPTIDNGNYRNEGIAFYAFKTQAVGTVPIYVHYNSPSINHYFTPDASPVIAPGFVRHGVEFYAYPSPNANSIPIYVHYNASSTDHYFTPNDAHVIAPGFVRYGVEFHGVK